MRRDVLYITASRVIHHDEVGGSEGVIPYFQLPLR